MLWNISGYDYGLSALSLMVPAFISAQCAWLSRHKWMECHAMADRELGVVTAGMAIAVTYMTSYIVTGKSYYYTVPYYEGLAIRITYVT